MYCICFQRWKQLIEQALSEEKWLLQYKIITADAKRYLLLLVVEVLPILVTVCAVRHLVVE